MSYAGVIQTYFKTAIQTAAGSNWTVADEWNDAERADNYFFVGVENVKAAGPGSALHNATLTVTAGVRSTDTGAGTALEGATAKLETLLDQWQRLDFVQLSGVVILGAANGSVSGVQYAEGFKGRTATLDLFFQTIN